MKTLNKNKYVLKDSLTDREKIEAENRFMNSKNLEKLTIHQVLEMQKNKNLQAV